MYHGFHTYTHERVTYKESNCFFICKSTVEQIHEILNLNLDI